MEVSISPGGDSLDLLQFWADVIGSVAWPLVALVALIMFRGPLSGLLAKLRTLAFGGAQVDFAELNKAASETAADVVAEVDPPSDQASEGDSSKAGTPLPRDLNDPEEQPEHAPDDAARRVMVQQAYDSLQRRRRAMNAPAASIMQDWARITDVLRLLGPQRGLDPHQLGTIVTVEMLASGGIIPPSVVHLVRQLRDIQRAAVQRRDVTATDAMEFQRNADTVIAALSASLR